MRTKQRDITYQHWRGVIQRETRDVASLELNGRRALADRDVRGDPTLESMIRADLAKRRAELEQDARGKQRQAASAMPEPDALSESADPTPVTSPQQVREAFDRLAKTLIVALERRHEGETQTALGGIRTLQAQNPAVISLAVVANCEQKVRKLRARLKQLRDQIAELTQQSVTASKCGNAPDLARSLRRLAAIHAAYPELLDDAHLNAIRLAALNATAERRQHRQTTRKLLEREGVIAADVERLAVAVREFHHVACTSADTSEEFRRAEVMYLRAIQEVRTYDTEWFTAVVLELADLLADWTVPPPGAEGQIDRFLDRISAGLKSIRAQMREIERNQESDAGDEHLPSPS